MYGSSRTVHNHYSHCHYQAKFNLLISHDYELVYTDKLHELYEKITSIANTTKFYCYLVSAILYPDLHSSHLYFKMSVLIKASYSLYNTLRANERLTHPVVL